MQADDNEMSEEHLTAQEFSLGYFNNVDEIYRPQMFVLNYENIAFALTINDVSFILHSCSKLFYAFKRRQEEKL